MTYASISPAGPAPTTTTSLRKLWYPPASSLAAVIEELGVLKRLESAANPGAIFCSLLPDAREPVVDAVDELVDGERFMKPQNPFAMAKA
jgi:hypothetical protein